MFLFGTDIKLAGSLSLALGLPRMLLGFRHYSRDKSFAILVLNPGFIWSMTGGSHGGAFHCGQLLANVSATRLLPLLTTILLFPAMKV